MLGLIVCQKSNLLSKHSFVFRETSSHDLGKREKVSTNCILSNGLNCAQNHLYLQTYSYFAKVTSNTPHVQTGRCRTLEEAWLRSYWKIIFFLLVMVWVRVDIC